MYWLKSSYAFRNSDAFMSCYTCNNSNDGCFLYSTHSSPCSIFYHYLLCVVAGQKKINNHAIHHFSFSDKLGNMKIEGATLHVHVKFLTPNADKKSYSIRLMEIVPTLAKGDSPVSIQVGLVDNISKPKHNLEEKVKKMRTIYQFTNSSFLSLPFKQVVQAQLSHHVNRNVRWETSAANQVDPGGSEASLGELDGGEEVWLLQEDCPHH